MAFRIPSDQLIRSVFRQTSLDLALRWHDIADTLNRRGEFSQLLLIVWPLPALQNLT